MTARIAFVFTFVTLASAFVHAYPSIGDKVTWSGEFKTAEGENSEIHITKEVVGFNSTNKIWKVKIDTKVGQESSSETIETADLFTPEKYHQVLKECESHGGVIETLETSPGKYKTCKMSTTENGIVIEKWWGDIPFGIVSKATRAPTGIANNDSPLKVATQGL
ncbi:hypothetical protein B9G69_011830 [Bdellovibrio sp. SKB1291214]|uniref:hypothetical protein n=1 Tax=Bdellovibrio sp. SKB1291214 TaxID=1732569 RepID=UPI000B51CFCC|nr:hypothetical protein [Bdellovibrio sp. SKB1291214]UYL07736.1 hypothetical protein B9G69_011830 [Bdellovibrio sp. SKB1291214]